MAETRVVSHDGYEFTISLEAVEPRSPSDNGTIRYTVRNTGETIIPAESFRLTIEASSEVEFINESGDVHEELFYSREMNPESSDFSPSGFDSQIAVRCGDDVGQLVTLEVHSIDGEQLASLSAAFYRESKASASGLDPEGEADT